MQPFDKIQEYSKFVCEQIRWQSAHGNIISEIENHIKDQRDAYMAEGMAEMEATENAILQMGDPMIIGTQLDRTHRPRPQWGLLLLTMAIVLMGVLVRHFWLPITLSRSRMIFEIISMIMGLAFMGVAYFSDFTLIGKYPKFIFGGIVGLSIVIINISPVLNGRAYYATFMPLLFPIGFVAILYATRSKGYLGIVLTGLSFMILSFITMLIPSASGFFNLGVVAGILLGIAVYKNWFGLENKRGYVLVFSMMALPLIVWISSRSIVFWTRFESVFMPSRSTLGGSYISDGVKRMLSNAKFIGHGHIATGLGTSDFQIPDVSGAFLLTYLIYNYGWITFIGIMSILAFFIFKGFKKSIRQKSILGLMVSLSIMTTYTIQVLGSVLWSFGFQLISPMTFPFIAYGNIAMVINLTLVGIMLSVFRTGDVVKDKNSSLAKRERFITLQEGKLIIDFGKK
ncbi:permease prefix domain 1-containing protein [Fusibacter sp. 3D3]|uniref:permease prefix domain 1-containing protein n=1 Tax=Fusibacter sp. 3D3 TaxID=1048380 RepID=UPI000852C0A0|nr:permease prefix domain 1-containing protein [Fusibacter sp. 3D3]GAU78080.1 cell division protein FtsW [Fusibacter sp. 3D3]